MNASQCDMTILQLIILDDLQKLLEHCPESLTKRSSEKNTGAGDFRDQENDNSRD